MRDQLEDLSPADQFEVRADTLHEVLQLLLSLVSIVCVLDVFQDFCSQLLRQLQVAHCRVGQVNFSLQKLVFMAELFGVHSEDT